MEKIKDFFLKKNLKYDTASKVSYFSFSSIILEEDYNFV